MHDDTSVTSFARTPSLRAPGVRRFLLQMAGSVLFGVVVWLLGVVLASMFAAPVLQLLCGLPAMLFFVLAAWEVRNRLVERMEIRPKGVQLTRSWRLKRFFDWSEVDTHLDPLFSSATNAMTATGAGLMEPLYPYYLRENGWAAPVEIAQALSDAQRTHYLPTLAAQIEAGDIVWFGDFGVSQQGWHRKERAQQAAASVGWHTIEAMSMQRPLLTWETIKIGKFGSRRTKRVQRPSKITLTLNQQDAPFDEVLVFHQVLLLLDLLRLMQHPVAVAQ